MPRDAPAAPTILEALITQRRVIGALMRRELSEQFNTGFFVYISSLLEPLFHIAIVGTIFYLLNTQPIYGTSSLLFIATGMYAYYFFIHLSQTFRGAARRSRGGRRVGDETVLDNVIASGLVKFVVYVLTGIALFAIIYVWGTAEAAPRALGPVVEGVLALSLLGLGLGLCHPIIMLMLPVWQHIWGPLSRLLMMLSSIFFVPDFLPLRVRDWLEWNPLMHAISTFRHGFYPNYPDLMYNRSYMWTCVLLLLALGLCLERVYRRRFDA